MNEITLNQNSAAAYIAYKFSDIIEFSSPVFSDASNMLEEVNVSEQNLFGQKTRIFNGEDPENMPELIFGAMRAGALASAFLKDTGFLDVNRIVRLFAANKLPAVFYIATDEKSAYRYNFGSDVGIFFPSNVQEAIDFSILAHLSIGKSYMPFVICLNNRITADENALMPDDEDIKKLFDVVALCGTRARALKRGISCDIEEPILLDADLTEIVHYYLNLINKNFGRTYRYIDYTGSQDADKVFVSFGTNTKLIEAAIQEASATDDRIGLIKIKALSPFPAKKFADLLPETAELAMLIGHNSVVDIDNHLLSILKKEAPHIEWIDDRYELAANSHSAEYITKAFAIFTEKSQLSDNKYWAGNMDSIPYAINIKNILDLGNNRWMVANSIAANNLEFGLGMVSAWNLRREWILNEVLFLADNTVIPSVSQHGYAYLEVKDSPEKSAAALQELLDDHVGADTHCSTCTNIRESGELLNRKYFWIYAGDCRREEIDTASLTRLLSSGENINLLLIRGKTDNAHSADPIENLGISLSPKHANRVFAKEVSFDLGHQCIEEVLHTAELNEAPSIVLLLI